MKCNILFLVFLFTCSLLHAQVDAFRHHNATLIPIKSAPLEMEGSPYFESDAFQRGKIQVGENELVVYLRYDVGNERMEIKVNPEDSDSYQLPYVEDITYFLGGKKFVIERLKVQEKTVFGYFVQYYDGSGVSLYGKPLASFTEAQEAKTGYQSNKPARIDISEKYYVIHEDGTAEEVTTRSRDLRRAFDSEVARNYLKENRVRNVEDLAAFVAFYDRNISKD